MRSKIHRSICDSNHQSHLYCVRINSNTASMFRKLITTIIVMVFCLLIQPVFSVEQDIIKADGMITKKPVKCWKMMPTLDEVLMPPKYGTVCKAFEEVLNTICEPPEKLKCNWTIQSSEKRFEKIEWQVVKQNEYHALIKDMLLGMDHCEARLNIINAEYRKAFEEGSINLKIADVDIDNDRRMNCVVKMNLRTRCSARSTFAVMNPQTKRMDWRYDNLMSGVNAFSEGSEIMLYNGKALMFKWERDFKNVSIFEGFSLFEGNSVGSLNICRFRYLNREK